MKRTYIIAIILVLVIFALTVSGAAAHYLGPDRDKPDIHNPSGDYIVLKKISGPGGVQTCTLHTNCTNYPGAEQQEYWCNSGVLHPGGWCSANPGLCWNGTITEQHCDYISGGSDPAASVSSSFTCDLTGNNGWCRSGPNLDLSASEPLSGKVITSIEGNVGPLCDPPDAASVSCSWTPPEGLLNLEFWAHSSYGDTSPKGNCSLKVNSQPPGVTLDLPSPNGHNSWFISPVSVSAGVSDSSSGPAGGSVQVDSGSWQAGSFTVSEQGTHTAQALGMDLAGNSALSSVVSFKLDSVPPTLVSSVPVPDGDNGWFVTAPILKLSGSDTTSGLAAAQIQVDGSGWQADQATVNDDGVHAITLRTTDVAGNSTTQSVTLSVDTHGPAITLDGSGTQGTNGWYIGSSVEALPTVSDGASGVAHSEMRLDGGAWLPVGPFTVLGDGLHTVEIQAGDLAGNQTSQVQQIRIDTTPPTLAPTVEGLAGLDTWFRSGVVVRGNPGDAVSGIAGSEIQVDGDAWQTLDQIELDEDGIYHVAFRTWDQAGNMATAETTVQVDRLAPTGEFTSPISGSTLKGQVQVSGTVQDGTSGIGKVMLSVDGSKTWIDLPVTPEGTWTYDWDTLHSSGGTRDLTARFTDLAGNTSSAHVKVIVANTPPSVRLTERWMIWESGRLEVIEGDVGISSVVIIISDPLDRWQPIVRRYAAGHIPQEVSWDRHFDEIPAPVGVYDVDVTVTDLVGQKASAHGIIVIPPVPSNTATSTLTPTIQATVTETLEHVTSSATLKITPTWLPGQTLQAVTPAPPIQLAPARQGMPYPFATWLLVLTGCGVVVVFSTTSLIDLRPKELHKIADRVMHIPHDEE